MTRPEITRRHSARWSSMRLPVMLGALGVGSVTLLWLRDPHGRGSYGFCPFKFFTGLECPGCGGLRAVNDLTHLDPGAASSSNVLVVALVAVLGVAYLFWLPKRWRGERARLIVLSPRVSTALIALIVVFTVVRNTPWGAWLAP